MCNITILPLDYVKRSRNLDFGHLGSFSGRIDSQWPYVCGGGLTQVGHRRIFFLSHKSVRMEEICVLGTQKQCLEYPGTPQHPTFATLQRSWSPLPGWVCSRIFTNKVRICTVAKSGFYLQNEAKNEKCAT